MLDISYSSNFLFGKETIQLMLSLVLWLQPRNVGFRLLLKTRLRLYFYKPDWNYFLDLHLKLGYHLLPLLLLLE